MSQATARDESRRTYTVIEAARLLGLGAAQAYAAVRRGDIPAMKIGKRWLVPKASLDALLEQIPPQTDEQPPAIRKSRGRPAVTATGGNNSTVALGLRVPVRIKDALAREASRNGRSLSQQAALMLQHCFEGKYPLSELSRARIQWDESGEFLAWLKGMNCLKCETQQDRPPQT